MISRIINRCLAYPKLSALSFGLAIVIFCFIAAVSIFDVVQRYNAYASSSEMLGRLNERAQFLDSEAGKVQSTRPPGSPLVEGQSATLASASLLQRITSAIGRAGGTVVSTEVEPPGPQFSGQLKAVVMCQLDQLALQQVLYDLEAGMPLLFVEHLTVSQLTPSKDDGQLRVTLGLSGIWTKGR